MEGLLLTVKACFVVFLLQLKKEFANNDTAQVPRSFPPHATTSSSSSLMRVSKVYTWPYCPTRK
jgi:hypothetical protein